MLFNSFEFILFFAVVYLLYRLSNHRLQNFMLLAASYLFYGAWDWRFLGLLLFTTAVDYACGLLIDQARDDRQRKLILAVSICVNLGVLVFFKYFDFFSQSLNQLALSAGIRLDMLTLKIILPIGISFYTFQSMSYTIDVYRRQLKAEKNFFDFALYVSFFPQLVAGPIERAVNLLPQIKAERTVSSSQIDEGMWLIYWGFFKKVFVADNLALIVNEVFAKTGIFPGGEALVGVYAFAFQIYGDFAGYSDIARGLAKLMGIELMVNFKFPYFVTNPRDFWRNWHISLSTWLRDYLYIPLGGSRGSRLITYRNIFITMLLGGLWHGAAWHFVIWGAYCGLLLMAYRALEYKPVSRVLSFAAVVFMFHLTCLGWLIFRAGCMTQAFNMLRNILLHFSWSPDAGYYFLKMCFVIVPLLALLVIERVKNDHLAILKWPALPKWALLLLIFYLITMFGEFGGKEFIYFQF